MFGVTPSSHTHARTRLCLHQRSAEARSLQLCGARTRVETRERDIE